MQGPQRRKANTKLVNYHSWIAKTLGDAGHPEITQQFDSIGKQLESSNLKYADVITPRLDSAAQEPIESLPVAA